MKKLSKDIAAGLFMIIAAILLSLLPGIVEQYVLIVFNPDHPNNQMLPVLIWLNSYVHYLGAFAMALIVRRREIKSIFTKGTLSFNLANAILASVSILILIFSIAGMKTNTFFSPIIKRAPEMYGYIPGFFSGYFLAGIFSKSKTPTPEVMLFDKVKPDN